MTSVERKEILELLAKGKISAHEAADLLSSPAASEAVKVVVAPTESEALKLKENGRSPSWLHVRVKDLKTGRNKVSVNIPLGMLQIGLKIGRRFSPELGDLDWNEINGLMQEMESGILVDVQDEEDGEHVQVYVD